MGQICLMGGLIPDPKVWSLLTIMVDIFCTHRNLISCNLRNFNYGGGSGRRGAGGNNSLTERQGTQSNFTREKLQSSTV